ncbi:hypothetical protein JAAARDRAFT_191605 [Jaapia argillacea MUCL 33604]|uniref:Uncharacterized protein n=1 Tax=Jaapia argillacea MUCL 33604 TaxID=933084 RepID=A0A067QC79_9AGAM|nr:hypothetical protein JAAARDRAFT_191605 [Jaapia argillacea MUCL 33604]
MHPRWKQGLSHTILGLRVIKSAADFAPIPQVKLVAGLVLKLLESVEKVEKCKDDCESLASRTAQMVFTILSEAQSHGPLLSEMESRVMKLAEVLNDTTQFMREQSRAPFLRRFLRQANTQAQIDEYHIRLEDTFRLFDSTSLIGMQRSLDHLQTTAEQTKNLQLVLSTDLRGLAESHPLPVSEYDGEFRVFKRSDIDLLECLETTLSYISIDGTPQCIVRSNKAGLGGRLVVVRTYEGVQSARGSAKDSQLLLAQWVELLANLRAPQLSVSSGSRAVNLGDVIFCDELIPSGDNIHTLLGPYSGYHYLTRACGPYDESEIVHTEPRGPTLSTPDGEALHGSSRISFHASKEGWTTSVTKGLMM